MANRLYKDFKITSVCRADVADRLAMMKGITLKEAEKKALKATDGEMERLASKMADAYCDNGFWIDLDILTEAHLWQ